MHSTKAVSFLASLVVLTLAAFLPFAMRDRGDPTVQALYYTKPIFIGSSINLDPANLALVQQYYLLENLALGLVRDDNRSLSGYEPGLAKSWTRPDESTWIFELDESALWSDGSPIEAAHIAQEICRLQAAKSRHLRMLRLLKDCRQSEDGKKLIMQFEQPVDSWLLHELSLADSAILHPSNRTGDWRITSGAYSIVSYSSSNLEINLWRNPHFNHALSKAPERVRLFWVHDPSELEQAFSSLKVDIFPTLANIFSRRQQIMSKNAPECYFGFPNSLHMFRFNWRNPKTHNDEARQAFSALIQEAFEGWPNNAILTSTNQFIPEFHLGRLDTVTPRTRSTLPLKDHALVLRISPQLVDLPEFEARLNSTAQRHNVKVTFIREETSTDDETGVSFASLYSFRGNQKDALGNWSFLYSKGGPFEPFERDIEPLLLAIASSRDDAHRADLLEQVHRETLSRAIGVPVFFESSAILSSGRYDLSHLNRFDLRPRFFRMTLR